jgi:hypothetical protein
MASDWDGVSDKIKSQIETKTDEIARKIVSGNGHTAPGIKTKFIFLMMRAFQKKNDYAPLDKDYWINKGWLGKERPWKRRK